MTYLASGIGGARGVRIASTSILPRLFKSRSGRLEVLRSTLRIAVADHNVGVRVDNRRPTISETHSLVGRLLRLSTHNVPVSRASVIATVGVSRHKDLSFFVGLCRRRVNESCTNGPVQTGGFNRERCIRTIGGGSIIFKVNPTKAKGAFLTMIVTIRTLGGNGMGGVVLAHPTIRTNRGLKFLPKSLGRGISPCLHPICSTLCTVCKIRRAAHLVSEKIVRVTPLTCVHKQALRSTFVVLSRTRGAAITRVGVFLAQLKFNSGVVIGNSGARVSLPGKTLSKLVSTRGGLGNVPSVTFIAFSACSIIQRPIITGVVGTCSIGRRAGRGVRG